jgi:Domain of unknown function (DUF4410)
MKWLWPVVPLIAAVAASTFGQATNTTLRNRYHTIEVAEFEVPQGVSFSAKRVAALQDEIVQQLQESKKAGEIIRVGEKAPHPGDPLLKLSGAVLRFNPGNQAERYFIGFGAGSTEIYAHVSLTDAASGRVFVTEDIQGIVREGFEQSSDVDRMVAERVVIATQLMLEKDLPKPGDDPSLPTEGPSLPAEQYSLRLESHDMTKAEEQVNAEAALGYRVVGADLTGKHTAVLEFEKPANQSQVYEYRLFHITLEGTMKKELREASQNGFCVTAHTLMPGFGGFVSWVMERPSGVSTPRCEYREHAPLRVSTTEHQIDEDKKAGFHFADSAEILGGHVVLMERFLDASTHQ